MKGRAWGVAILAGAGIAGLLAACGDSTPTPSSNIKFVGNDTCPTAQASPYDPSPPQTNGGKVVGQAIDEMPHTHVAPPARVQYNHDPPTSGCHYIIQGQAPVEPGVYGQEIPAEYWVHNLEHGYIVILYNCPQGCPDDVQKLIAWHKTLGPDPAGQGVIKYAKVLVLPWHTMTKKFAAVSWDYYQGWDTLDISLVQAFYDNHVGRSPESPLAA